MTTPQQTAVAPRPNILVIVCDQLRADHTGFGGSSYIRTPNLDRLASGGRSFDRAYVANPICMPNRASLLTGRVPSAHGVVANNSSLAWTTNTFVRCLRAAGYRTALVGKADLQNGMRRDVEPQVSGPAPLGDPYDDGWDRWEDPKRYVTEPFADPDDFYGFDYLALTIGHGDMVGGHHLRWALGRGAQREQLAARGAGHARKVSDHWWQVYQPWLPEELYSTTFVTEMTIEFIEHATAEGSPWFAECSFPDPHHPFTPPGRWFDRHDPADMPVPETFVDDLSGAPGHYERFRRFNQPKMLVQMFGPTEEEYRDAAAAEAGAIEMIDDGVGRILAALDRTGAADDTVIVFTADHGEMFGDHGLMLKGMMQYEGCTRVPLVIAGPAVRTAGPTPSLASTLDLAPTLLDIAGVDGYGGMQGVSLTPVLTDPTAAARDAVYVEEDFPQADAFRFPVPSRARTVITQDARLTRYADTGEGELYDLDDDPLERVNRWAEPGSSARRRELTDRLTDALMAHADPPRLGVLGADVHVTS